MIKLLNLFLDSSNFKPAQVSTINLWFIFLNQNFLLIKISSLIQVISFYLATLCFILELFNKTHLLVCFVILSFKIIHMFV